MRLPFVERDYGAPVRDVEIRLPPDADCCEIGRIIDQAIAQAGLTVTLRDELKRFPGCIHWHAKNGRQSGTLEITLWPQQHRAWFTIQDGRAADWIDAKMTLLQEAIGQGLDDL
ncbi:MAG TPA: hypothetical protein VHY91_01310 [Pirellulales bacterium]|nr:hypothetical protein [Pirellulales bacterium]